MLYMARTRVRSYKTNKKTLKVAVDEGRLLNFFLVREQKQVESAIENMIKAIEQGVVTTSTAKRLKELDEKRDELERKILIEQNRVAIRVTESDIRKYYREALTIKGQELIDYLVKEVVLYDDKIEIYFNTPTRTSPDENRGFSICTRTIDRMNIEILIK